jgi:PAS domain S-box-containing protein/diguanylate cyclase (GGDEF)-like protein
MGMDGPALNVLLVEDSPADAELVLRSLGDLPLPIEHVRVSNEAELRRALAALTPDIILSDFSMPGFSGQDALLIARQQAPHVPFLFVSGTIGEELAIEALQRGALDYVLKDNLRRLPSAVERALGISRERAALERAERALRASEERFRAIVETSRDWIWEMDAGLRLTYSNHAVLPILGCSREEISGRSGMDLLPEQDRDEVQLRLAILLQQASGWHRWQIRFMHRDGSIRVLESSSTPLIDDTGALTGVRGVAEDITERLEQELRIRQLARIQSVVAALGNAVLRASDRKELFLAACRVAVEQGGFRAAALGTRGSDGSLHIAARHGDPLVLAVVAPEEPIPIDAHGHYGLHPGVVAFREGRKVAVESFTRADLPDALRAQMARIGVKSQVALPIGSEPWGLLALFSDAERTYDTDEIDLLQRLAADIDYAVEFLAKSERLEHLAYHNPVTGLPNRSAFQGKVSMLSREGPVMVVVLDIQRFSYINDSRGRSYGDNLLLQVGLRLKELMGEHDVVAHPEADAYLLALPMTGSHQQHLERLDAALTAFERHAFLVDGEEVYLALHGGVAFAPEHGKDAKALERSALMALADGIHRNTRVGTFSESLRGKIGRRVDMERDLRHAIDSAEFELHYQPKFDTATRRLAGAEALLRWRHPRDGMISPAEFIPVLEETGLIVPVGRWVMQQALATALEWRARYQQDLRIAVNVSARELRHKEFMDGCRAMLASHAAAQALDIELTESLLMQDMEHSVGQLEALRELGCKVSIDDFGTGYSSLNYLARLPVDELKIDISFISLMTQSPETMGLVTNIISLAHSLSLQVVAEGVEEDEQAKLLRLLRCDQLQGYLFGRPMAAAAIVAQHFSAVATGS